MFPQGDEVAVVEADSRAFYSKDSREVEASPINSAA
jgi:hypothetical protein